MNDKEQLEAALSAKTIGSITGDFKQSGFKPVFFHTYGIDEKGNLVEYTYDIKTQKEISRQVIATSTLLPIARELVNKYFWEGDNILSAKERQLVMLTCAGKTLVQAGKEMFLSKRTLEKYKRDMLQRFKCRSSSQLIYTLMSLGIIK